MTVSRYAGAMANELIDTAGIAQMLGVGVPTVRTYLGRARANRAAGTPRPGDLPEPDELVAGKPAWTVKTIERWLAERPGPGRGNRPNRKPPAKRRGAA